MKRMLYLLLMVIGSLGAMPAWGQSVLYAADGRGTVGNLYILNPANGAVVTTVGSIGFSVTGLAIHPITGIMYGSTGRESGPSLASLITINKTTGAGTLIGAFNVGGDTMADLTFTPDGTLYGWNEPSVGGLNTVNLATGQATLVGNAGIVGSSGSGLAANASGTLFYAGSRDGGPLRTVDRVTGAPTTVATLTGIENTPINALAFSPANVLFASTKSRNLLSINTGTGAVSVLGATVFDIDAIVFDGAQVTSTAVPTLSGWALIAMALLLSAIVVLQLRRKNRRASST